MQLREAIAKAAKFAWRGKQRSPTKYVRFLPNENGNRCAIHATNGPQHIIIWLDSGITVPNVMIDAEKLSAVIKGVKEVTIDTGSSEFAQVSGVRLEVGNVSEFPELPAMPTIRFQKLDDWWAIRKVLHAVSKDTQQPLLQCVHFRRDLVETTDRFRIARVFVETPWKGLVPASTFRHWPDGDVSASFSDDIAAFQVGDEVRYSVLKRGVFQDCDELLPPWYEGSKVTLDPIQLREAVKRTKALCTTCQVFLTSKTVQIEGGGFCQGLPTYHAIDASETPIVLHVNAAWLYDALSEISTNRVVLGYTDVGEPLRIESGPFVVGIWPFFGG